VRDLLTAGMINLSDGYKNDPANFLPISGPGQAIEDLSNTYVVDLTPPPTPTGFAASAGLTTVIVQTNAPVYTAGNGHSKTRLYGVTYAGGAQPTFLETYLIAEFTGPIFSFPATLGSEWRLWVKWVSNDGVASVTPAGGVNGLAATTGKIGNADLNDLIITAGKLADGSVSGTKLAALAIDATKFAAGIEPVGIVSAVPGAKSTTTIVNTVDGKLYRWNGSAYSADISGSDLTGVQSDGLVYNPGAELGLAGWAMMEGSGSLSISTSSPQSGSSSFALSGPAVSFGCRAIPVQAGDVYYISAWVKGSTATSSGLYLYGMVANSIGASGVVDYTVSGRIGVYLSAYSGAAYPSAWTLCEGQITIPSGYTWLSVGIANWAGGPSAAYFDSVSVGKVITAAKIAANTITAGQIAANTITAGQIAAGAISATQIAAGAISVQKLLIVPVSLCPDPFFDDQAWWGGSLYDSAGWFFEGGSPVGAKTRVTLWGERPTNAPGTSRKHLATAPLVPPAAGTTLRLRCRAINSSNQACYLIVRFTSSADINLGDIVLVLPTGTDAATDFSVQGAVPADAAFMRFIIFNEAGTTFTGVATMSGVMLDVAASSDLIVDGAITANKIAANAIAVGSAAIQNGAIVNAMIGNLAVDDAKISGLAVSKLTAGSLSVGQYIRSTSYVAGISGWAINADGSSEFSNVTVRGNVTGSNITGSTITGSTIRTAETGQRISFDSQGLLFLTGATPAGKYGSFKYGAKKYGAGVLVFFNNVAKRIPFYVQQEQDVADIHLFNRISDPTGPAEIGDLVCVGGKLKICTANGTPGTWTVVGTQT
jgi:hypothetical protein